MGKISTYQRSKLASAIPQLAPQDNSGQIIANAATSFMGTVVDIAARREDETTTIGANADAMKFGMSFYTVDKNTRKTMSNNPTEYPQKSMEAGVTLANDMAAKIPNGMRRTKFLSQANGLIKANQLRATTWADAKVESNAIIDSEEITRLSSILAGNTTDIAGLDAGYAEYTEAFELSASMKALSDSERIKQLNKGGTAILTSHLGNRAINDTHNLLRDLNSKNNPYEKKPGYTNEIKTKYIKACETRINTQNRVIRESQNVNRSELTMEAIKGTMTFDMIQGYENNDDPMKTLDEGVAPKFKEALIKKIVHNAALIKEKEPARKFVDAIVGSTKIDKLGLAKVLELILDNNTDGIISEKEGAFLTEVIRPYADVPLGAWEASVKVVQNTADRLYGGDLSRQAQGFRALIDGITKGVPANAVAAQLVLDMQKKKAIEDNPNLAGSDDPVGDAYKRMAIQQFKDEGYKYDDKMVAALAQAIKVENEQ